MHLKYFGTTEVGLKYISVYTISVDEERYYSIKKNEK